MRRTERPQTLALTSFGKALLRQLQPSIPTTTRTITYDYDGLQRLTSASESPGTTQTYAYDLAGNRSGVWVNGTRTQNYSYNAANQVTGWSYDAAGNLLNDGAQSYSYDALGRVLTVGTTSNQYNADGTLVAQTTNSITTRSVHDLAAPLSQILGDGTQRFVYGNPAERLFAQQGSSARTWYSGDALGSVRATLNDAGLPQAVASYDAWGVPETPLLGSFGFTGELQRGSDVWLRARWYGAGRGSFGSRDPYQGDAQRPYSLQYYPYAYSNPVLWTDASGLWVPDDTHPPSTQVGPCTGAGVFVASMGCVLPGYYEDEYDVGDLANDCALTVNDLARRLAKPINMVPLDIGYILGAGFSFGLGGGLTGGFEIVYDLYDFEVNAFLYSGGTGTLGGSMSVYAGAITGWSTFKNYDGVNNYKGHSGAFGGGLGMMSIHHVRSEPLPNDDGTFGQLVGMTVGIGPSDSVSLPKNLPKIFRMAFDGSTVNARTVDEMLAALKPFVGEFQHTFHAQGQRPTMTDTLAFMNFAAHMGGPLAPAMVSSILANGIAWQHRNN